MHGQRILDRHLRVPSGFKCINHVKRGLSRAPASSASGVRRVYFASSGKLGNELSMASHAKWPNEMHRTSVTFPPQPIG